jgi:hypothetical protein
LLSSPFSTPTLLLLLLSIVLLLREGGVPFENFKHNTHLKMHTRRLGGFHDVSDDIKIQHYLSFIAISQGSNYALLTLS